MIMIYLRSVSLSAEQDENFTKSVDKQTEVKIMKVKVMLMAAVLAVPVLANADVYLTGGVAHASVDMKAPAGATQVNDTYQRVIVGVGLGFNQYLSAQVNYLTEGKTEFTQGSSVNAIKQSTVQVAAVGLLPVTAQFRVLGKIAANMSKVTYAESLNANAGVNQNQTNAGFGLGVQYQVNDQVAVNLVFDRIVIKNLANNASVNNDRNVNQVALTMDYHF